MESLTVEGVFNLPSTSRLMLVLISSYLRNKDRIEQEKHFFEEKFVKFPLLNITWGAGTFWRATEGIEPNIRRLAYDVVMITVSIISQLDEFIEQKHFDKSWGFIKLAKEFSERLCGRAAELNFQLSSFQEGLIVKDLSVIGTAMYFEVEKFNPLDSYVQTATSSNGFNLVCRVVAYTCKEGKHIGEMMEVIELMDKILRVSMDMLFIKWSKDYREEKPNVLLHEAMKIAKVDSVEKVKIAHIRKARRILHQVILNDLEKIHSTIQTERLRKYATIRFAESVLSQVLHISWIAYPPRKQSVFSPRFARTEM